ncbi:MAG: hypothetical protein AAF916_08705 [Planctomycetota bacterium]
MNEPSDPPHFGTLPEDVQAKFEAHLDAVDAVLMRYGQNRSQRASITDELDGQLRDMLTSHCDGTEPTVEDAESVLAEVEPPEAFARRSIDLEAVPVFSGFADDDAPPPRTSVWAIAGLVCVILGVLASVASVVTIAGLFVGYMSHQAQPVAERAFSSQVVLASHSPPLGPSLAQAQVGSGVSVVGLLLIFGIGFLPLLVFAVLAMACGIVAMGKIKAAPRHVGGWGLAVFDVVFFPFWVVWGVLTAGLWVGVFYAVQSIKLLSGKMNVFEDGWHDMPSAEFLAWGPVGTLLGLALTVWITRATVLGLQGWRSGNAVPRRPFPLGILVWLCFGLAVGLIAVAFSGIGDGDNFVLPAIGVLVLGAFLGVVAGRRGYGWFAALACALGAGVLLYLR